MTSKQGQVYIDGLMGSGGHTGRRLISHYALYRRTSMGCIDGSGATWIFGLITYLPSFFPLCGRESSRSSGMIDPIHNWVRSN